MAEALSSRLPHIYLLYGLAFFALGLAVALELGRVIESHFRRALRSLAVFGLVHGFHEWFEMFELVGEQAYGFAAPAWLEWLRMLILAFSFLTLSAFGLGMLRPSQLPIGRNIWFLLTMLIVCLVGVLELGAWLEWSMSDWLKAVDSWTRYILGIPGALLAAWGLLIQRRIFVEQGLSAYGRGLVVAALTFAVYGLIGQFIVSPSALYPSTVINTEWFLRTVGFPVQLLRAGSASLIAIYTIRSLRAFDVHRRRQLAAAQMQAQEMVARRDALRGDLFRRAVSTQEEERRRIARELHDEIGQTLTGLAAGLRGVQQSLTTDMEGSRLQLRQLEGMVVRAIGELGNLVADLRPSLLDDLGLQAALSWYVDAVNQRGVTQVELVFEGLQHRLPPEVETIFFRITQEALTNVTRHAKASQAVVEFACDKTLARLRVSDDGEGFTPEPVLEGEQQVGWGLVGIRERVQLAGGKCIIDSAPGRGTVLTVEIPLLGLKEDESGAH